MLRSSKICLNNIIASFVGCIKCLCSFGGSGGVPLLQTNLAEGCAEEIFFKSLADSTSAEF